MASLVFVVLGCTPAEIVLVERDTGVAPEDDAAVTDVPAEDVPTADVITTDVPVARDAVSSEDVARPRDGGAPSTPSRCADVRRVDPTAGDGEYTLYVQGDPRRPWRAWCRGMSATPAEYLTLMNRGDERNFSQYTAGGARPGTNVRTVYSRVRVDPVSMRVHLGDQTFTTSTGRITSREGVITSMPYGVAADCVGGTSRAGIANVDLRGTPFALAEGTFVVGGFMANGGASVSGGGRVADLRGGGYCGWIAPRDTPYNPVNNVGAFLLPLVWVGN